MKLKLIFINIISLVLLVALAQVILAVVQVVNIPPYAEHVRAVYKSGYFVEIERGFNIIKDTFIEIKNTSGAEQAWVFLSDLPRKHGITVEVYDPNGYQVLKPGLLSTAKDVSVMQIINAVQPRSISKAEFGTYTMLEPMLKEGKCVFCHKNSSSQLLGVLKISRSYNASAYFSAEKILFFSILIVILTLLLYYIIQWDPGKNIKELFDKK